MARTRSKKMVIPEDETVASSQIEQGENCATGRLPFTEIINSTQAVTVEDIEIEDQVKVLKAAFKTEIGVKKNRNRGKKGKRQDSTAESMVPEILDDSLAAARSPAAQEARQILNSDEENTPMAKDLPCTSISSATSAVRQQLHNETGQLNGSILLHRNGYHAGHLPLTPAINFPSSGQSVQAPASNQHANPRNFTADRWLKLAEDSIFNASKNIQASQKYRTQDFPILESPSKSIMTFESVEKACEEAEAISSQHENADDEDSFIQEITSRSPAKPVTRIEDSVEALDKLEEVIEALDDVALPRSTESSNKSPSTPCRRMISPTDVALAAKRAAKAAASATNRVKSTKPPTTERANKSVKISKSKDEAIVNTDTDTSQKKTVASKKPVKRPASLLPPKQPVKSVKRATRPTFELPGEAVARKLKEQREARELRREGSVKAVTPPKEVTPPKIKSTKQVTLPTFELPGEAVSRKKREQHEALLKAKEEEERQRREFKAKPIRKSIVPSVVPRDTAASRARKSQLGVPDFQNAATGHLYNSLTVAKRGSVVGAHRPSILAANMANVSAPRAPGPSRTGSSLARKASTTSGPSMSGLATQRTVSASDAQIQRQRAKEIYQRDARTVEMQERERREREAAAKKSREDAAERGRQASREWAEKQRAKADRGLMPGYGPGGQLGLKQ